MAVVVVVVVPVPVVVVVSWSSTHHIERGIIDRHVRARGHLVSLTYMMRLSGLAWLPDGPWLFNWQSQRITHLPGIRMLTTLPETSTV